MVTEENLAEELVGDIFSHDQKLELQYLQESQPGIYDIDCAMDIDDFGKLFNLNIVKDNFETLGGYLLHACGHIPANNEQIDLVTGQFTVLEANRRAVRRVRYKPKRASIKS